LEANPNNVKALMRRGLARESNEKWADALSDFNKVLAMDPAAQNAKSAVSRCLPHVRAEAKQEAAERISKANAFKDAGNKFVAEKNNTAAVVEFTKGLEIAPEGNRVRVLLHSNRSAAHLALGNNEEALDDASKCLALDSSFIKAYFRKGVALHKLERWTEAIAAFDQGLTLEPGHVQLIECKAAAEKAREQDAQARTKSAARSSGTPSAPKQDQPTSPPVAKAPAVDHKTIAAATAAAAAAAATVPETPPANGLEFTRRWRAMGKADQAARATYLTKVIPRDLLPKLLKTEVDEDFLTSLIDTIADSVVPSDALAAFYALEALSTVPRLDLLVRFLDKAPKDKLRGAFVALADSSLQPTALKKLEQKFFP